MPAQHAPGTPVKFQTGRNSAPNIHTGTVTGHKVTAKGDFLHVKRADGREFTVRPARVSVS